MHARDCPPPPATDDPDSLTVARWQPRSASQSLAPGPGPSGHRPWRQQLIRMDRSIVLVEGLEPVLDVKRGQIGQGWRHRLGDPVFGGVEQQHEVVILVHRLLKSLQVVFAGGSASRVAWISAYSASSSA